MFLIDLIGKKVIRTKPFKDETYDFSYTDSPTLLIRIEEGRPVIESFRDEHYLGEEWDDGFWTEYKGEESRVWILKGREYVNKITGERIRLSEGFGLSFIMVKEGYIK